MKSESEMNDDIDDIMAKGIRDGKLSLHDRKFLALTMWGDRDKSGWTNITREEFIKTWLDYTDAQMIAHLKQFRRWMGIINMVDKIVSCLFFRKEEL